LQKFLQKKWWALKLSVNRGWIDADDGQVLLKKIMQGH
jgi:hypothetical protein